MLGCQVTWSGSQETTMDRMPVYYCTAKVFSLLAGRFEPRTFLLCGGSAGHCFTMPCFTHLILMTSSFVFESVYWSVCALLVCSRSLQAPKMFSGQNQLLRRFTSSCPCVCEHSAEKKLNQNHLLFCQVKLRWVMNPINTRLH